MATGRRDMAIRKEKFDGRSRPSNKAYEESWNRIFGKKQIDELAESYKQSRRNKKERDNKNDNG